MHGVARNESARKNAPQYCTGDCHADGLQEITNNVHNRAPQVLVTPPCVTMVAIVAHVIVLTRVPIMVGVT
jgi:hypothetical protein